MICPHCQKEHPDGTKFCPFTGKTIPPPEMRQPEIPQEHPPSGMTACPNCGRSIVATARFCPYCRAEVTPSTNPVMTGPPYAPAYAEPPAAEPAPAPQKPAYRRSLDCCLSVTAALGLGLIALLSLLVWFVNLEDYRGSPLADPVILLQEQVHSWFGEPSAVGGRRVEEQEAEAAIAETAEVETAEAVEMAEAVPSETAAQEPPPADTPVPTSTQALTATSIPTATVTATPTVTASPTATVTATPVYSSSWNQGRLVFPVKNGSQNALYLLELQEGSEPVLLLSDAGQGLLSAPVFSPDGTKITFHFFPGQLQIMDAAPGAVPAPLGECAAASWSPDGTRVICNLQGASFTIFDSGNGYIVDSVDVSIPARIPAWSPLGGEIAFVYVPGGSTSIYRKTLGDSSEPVQLAGEASENYAPAYSPDGQWIAYQSNQGSAQSEIWIMDRDGGQKRRVTNTPGGSWSRAPSWSPDGKWLAFVSSRAGSSGADYGEVFVVDILTGETIQVTSTGGNVYDWRVSWGR